MKAISLWQPWASLVVEGYKDVENRPWRSFYRGPLLIHASLKWDQEGADWIEENCSLQLALKEDHEQGQILGIVDMVECVKDYNSPWFFGPYGFVFENPKQFKQSITYRGRQGLFNVPDEIITEANNFDKKCSKCGKPGACENGLCLKCNAERIK